MSITLAARSRRLTARSTSENVKVGSPKCGQLRVYFEEDDLIEVAFEEGAIKAVHIRMCYVAKSAAEAVVERSREALPGEFVGDELHERVGEFRLSSAVAHCVGVNSAAVNAGIVSARTVAAGSMVLCSS